MADSLPSLFDFDDEPGASKGNQNSAQKSVTVKTAGEGDSLAKRQATPTSDYKNEDKVTDRNSESKPSKEDISESVQEKTKSSPNPTSNDRIKPSIELPKPAPRKEIKDKTVTESEEDKAISVSKKKMVFFESAKSEPADDDAPVVKKPKNISSENIVDYVAKNEEAEMTTDGLPQWDLDKNYYTIGEVAKLFGVNVSHIRFWTTAFKIKTRTTRKGDRLYTPEQIKKLRLIHHLVKERKHTLQGAKEILLSGEAQLEVHLDLKKELRKLHQALSDLKDKL